MKNKYWQINNKSAKEAEILLYDFIGEDGVGNGIGAKQFAEDIKKLGNISKLSIRINSPGGNVFEGNTIYNILKQHRAHKNVYIDGIAASIASVVAMSGDTIYIADNGMMMIHNPWAVAVGDSSSMIKMAEALNKIKTTLINSYRKKTRLADWKIAEMMDEETWMDSGDAIRMGFADSLFEQVKAAASFNLSYYKNVPESLKNKPRSVTDAESEQRAIKYAQRRRQLELADAELSLYK